MGEDDKKNKITKALEDLLGGAVIDATGEDGKAAGGGDDLDAESVSITVVTGESQEEFGDFAEFEVYDGAEAEGLMEGMAGGTAAAREKGEAADEEVVVEQYPEAAEVEPGIVSPVELERGEWKELIAVLKGDAEAQHDPVVASKFHAEIGRIYERRVGDRDAALEAYEEALKKDSACLLALQGKRRICLLKGRWDEVVTVIQSEKALAEDEAVLQRIEGAQTEMEIWRDGELAAAVEFERLGERDPGNPYCLFMGLAAALGRKDTEKAARQMARLADLGHDKIFSASLKSAAGLLHEVIDRIDDAARLYDEARGEGGAGFDRMADLGLWRIEARRGRWAEAEACASMPFDEADSALIRGHRFLLAAQMLLVLGKAEEAGSLVRLIPQTTASWFLQYFSALGREGAQQIEVLRKFEERVFGPPPLKAALQWLLAEGTADSSEKVLWYRRCMDSAPALALPEIELALFVSGKEGGEHSQVLEPIVESCLKDPGRVWLAAHIGMKLIESGREKEGEEILARYIKEARDEDFIWLLGLVHLARGRIDAWLEFMTSWSSMINDPDALLGVRLLQADVNEFIAGKKIEAQAIYKNLITDSAPTAVPFHILAFNPEHVEDAILFNKQILMEHLTLHGGEDLIPAALSILGSGAIREPAERLEIYRKIFEQKSGHLPAFCALRRELLAAGRYEEYFQVLSEFLGVSQRLDPGLLGSDRMTLLWLSKQSLVDEDDLRKFLSQQPADPFVPIYLSVLDMFPKLSAEAVEELAAKLPAPSSQKWWYDAARKWAGSDTSRMLKCIEKLDEEAWKNAGTGLVEIDAWLRQEWTGITDRLMEALRALPEGADQTPVLGRMAYVDLMLKGDTSMGLAEVQSMLQGKTAPPLIEMRMLYKHLLEQDRNDELLPTLRALSILTKGSEEARAWSWLAYRLGRSDDAVVDTIYYELLGDTEKIEGDVPLLLLKEILAVQRKDFRELARILEALVLSVEGDREKGCLLWLLAIVLAEPDLENSLNFARECIDKIPVNPGCAFLAERIATVKEDWATAAMSARLAGGLFRETEHAVDQLLRAAELYREKVDETGWAVQSYEQVLSMDPKNTRAFDGLKSYYADSASWDRLASLLESRIAQLDDGQEKQSLRYGLADTYEKAGRLSEAVKVATDIVDADPEVAEAQQLLAHYAIRAEQWDTAASAFQQYLTLPIPDESKVETFLRLGDIYVDQIPDADRAIYCYEKVNEYGPIDLEVAEKLAELYSKTMKWEKGLEQAQMLFENSDEPQQKMKWLLMAGHFFEEGAKDLRRAEKAYETARGLLPTAHEPIVHMIRLYKRKNDSMALNFMIQRSIGDMRVFQQRNPDDMSLYHTIMHIVSEAGDGVATRLMGTLLEAFMELLPDETLLLRSAGGEITWRGGPWVAMPELEEYLLPATITPAVRMLLERLEETLMKSIPTDPGRYGISKNTRMQKKAPGDEMLLDEVAGWFGVKKPQVHIVDVLPNMLGVLADSPPLLVVGEAMFSQLSQAQKHYVFAWGCKLIQSKFLPLLCVSEDEMPGLWVSMIQQFEPSYFLSGVSAETSSKFSYRLQKNFPKKLKEELFGIALECSSDPNIDVPNMYTSLVNYADRAALLACGSIREAINLHWRLHAGAQEPVTSGSQIHDVLSESPVMARLCEFIMSGLLAKCIAFYPSGQ